MKTKFYICPHCGNLIGMVKDKGVPVVCCGQKMQPLVPNTVEASGEKHIPVASITISVITERTPPMMSCLVICFFVYVFISFFCRCRNPTTSFVFILFIYFLQHNDKLMVIICQY